MDYAVDPPRLSGLKFTLVAGLMLLTTDALFAQSDGQSDVDALKAQMNQMQRQYEQRIEAMEAKMKALESNANSGSILNTRVLTDADGKEMAGKAPGPLLDESFLKSLTRNFTFNVYMRAGFAFNGSGGAQGGTTFEMPDNYVGGGRSTSRLGNEQDFYTELSWNQAHILGDSPDVADVSFRATMQAFSNFVKTNAVNTQSVTAGTPGAGVGMVEGYAEMKNIFKSAPEITFWGGDRFYDRYNIDSEDYFWLNTSGFGVGVYNIPAGPGTLWLAWIGNNQDNLNEAGGLSLFNANDHVGDLFKQTFDVRYKDIDIGLGKLSFVLIGNYVKGDTYESTFTSFGGTVGGVTFGRNVTGIVKTSDMWGIGGGAIWDWNFGNKSELRVSALYGYGATDFQANISNQINAVNNAWENQFDRFLVRRPNTVQFVRGSNGLEPFVAVNPINRNTEALATAYFVWNPSNCFSMGLWANWEYNDNGTNAIGIGNNGLRISSGSRNLVTVGFRPVYWVADNIAIQGAASGAYIDTVRTQTGNAFGRSGEYGILTIAPTIKPNGGFFTRPEIRVFATFAAWSNSLKGTSASGGEPPYSNPNGKATYGWLFGSQMEIWF
ncbi:MAG: carbohydrate porin [Verrucomicrobia bacterium]|nr:carbohydrate porin [Verrucomicrobiota bacterium]